MELWNKVRKNCLHVGEKPFKCNFCDEKFRQESHVKRHERVHTDEKPFTCTICDEKFTDKTLANEHQMSHSGEKPFGCNLCDKKFALKSKLKRHERVHTGKEYFSILHIFEFVLILIWLQKSKKYLFIFVCNARIMSL